MDDTFDPPPPDLVDEPSAITTFIPLPLKLDNFLRNGNPYRTPDWIQVFDQADLDIVTDPFATLTISTGSRYWESVFSSSENTARFGSSSIAAQADNPDAAVVLGLKLPTTAPLNAPIKFADLRGPFGITENDAPPALIAFLNAVDQSGALELSLDNSSSARHGLFIVPEDAYMVTINMVFKLSNQDAIQGLQGYLNSKIGMDVALELSDCSFEFQRTDLFVPDTSTPESDFDQDTTYRFTIALRITDFHVSFVFTPGGVDFYLADPPGAPVSGNIVERLNRVVSGAGGGTSIPAGSLTSGLLRDINLWYISAGKDVERYETDASGNGTPIYGDLYWKINLLCAWNVGAQTQTILLSLQYDSRSSTFTGDLVFHDSLPDAMAKRQPSYFAVTDELPASVVTLLAGRPIPNDLSLWDLFTDKGNPPKGIIPTALTEGIISFKKQATDGYDLNFTTTIEAPEDPSGIARGAPSPIVWKKVGVQVTLDENSSGSTTDVQISTAISLNPAPGQSIPPAILCVVGEYYTGGSWLVHGRLENVSVALMASFFTEHVGTSGILGSLALKFLDITYTFSNQGEASSFLITGALVVGGLELDLTYQYASELLEASQQTAAQIMWTDDDSGRDPSTAIRPSSSGATPAAAWVFEAKLGASSPGATLGSVVDSFSPNTSSSLPTFIRNIDIPPAAGDSAPILLRLAAIDNDTSSGPGDRVLLTLRVSFPHLVLTFLSLSVDGNVKRLLRVSADQIPLIDRVPIVQIIPQPFDELLYLWLDDPSNSGITRSELNWINDALDKSTSRVLVKEANNSNALAALVLLPGHHFMIVQGGKVVLDHVFGQANPDDETTPPPTGPPALADPTKGDIEKQLPFLDIHAITLQFKAPVLRVSIDATIALGPVKLSVIDFHLDFDLGTIQLNDLASILRLGLISAGISGLAVSLNIPPVKIAGVFLYSKSGEEESYAGGVAFGFEPWQFMAVGEYRKLPKFKSVFVYAKLDGPLVTLAFATVSGVRLGFGYNSAVRSPTLLELPSFPFLDGSGEGGSGSDPMEVMLNMMGRRGQAWITAKEDSYWVVAGLKMTAFGILSVTAVAMLGFRDHGVIISVFAQGCAQMPPAASPDISLFYVEVGMLAELNTVEGYFTVQAALAPASHVLLPSCRLVGGFALVNWFDPSTYSGDFVFTVGGYHRAYQPPPWYPIVPRIGVQFTLAEIINVSGVVYFAVTPKCVMGGGAVHFGLEIGPVSAWLDVMFDVFVQFKPFHYMADLAVSVGCAISIKVWFIHITVKVSVGAQLHIEGPDPFCGYATVEFYLFAFTIRFGDSRPAPLPIDLWEFYDMVQVPGPEPAADANSTITDKRLAQHKYTVTSGLLPPDIAPSSSPSFPSAGATTSWRVLPGTFTCSIGFDFAISSADLITSDDGAGHFTPLPILPLDGSTIAPFYSKPMHLAFTPITSTVTIRVYRRGANPFKNTVVDVVTASLVTKDVPVAMWGQYDPRADPAQGGRSATTALADPSQPTMKLCMAINLVPKPPTLVASAVQDFQPAAAFRQKLGPSVMDALEPMQSNLLPSAEVHPAEGGVQRWAHVAEDWTNAAAQGAELLESATRAPAEAQGDGILRAAATVLRWSKPPPSASVSVQEGRRGAWALNPKLPARLVREMATRWPVLPRYTNVGA